jgi:hypothetical protein
MSRWFRMYDEILDDPKVQKLPAEDFRAWVNILCLASKNEGVLPSADDIAFALRRSPNDVVTLLERLLNATLIDKRNGGPNGYHYAPHGWDKRQFKSDTSTERVKRFRNRQRNAEETPPEPDTESDTEQSPQPPTKRGARLAGLILKDWLWTCASGQASAILDRLQRRMCSDGSVTAFPRRRSAMS